MNEKIKEFINRWQNKGREKQDTQTFWIELLTDVLGVEDATKRIDFEKTVKIQGDDGKDHTKFIDGYIPETKVLIEQKDAKLSLNKAYSMSGTNRKYTPYEQGDRYGRHLNQREVPRYIIACNFKEIEIHDNNHRGEAPQVVKLEDLEQDYTRLLFLINNKNEHLEREKELSVKAGQLVGRIYDALLKMYKDPEDKGVLESLNILIVRLVFILYAEDAGIFKKQQFLNYMEQFRNNPGAFRRELLTLFDVLDTPYSDRDPYMEKDLSEFPYVNGGLFNKDIRFIVPSLNKEVINLILSEASAGFDWQGISPTIFGATFESTLNPQTRHSGGMHYTSLENIHKVIDPLFLNDLKEDLIRIEKIENAGSRVNALRRYIDRLSCLKFFDPACGSGNFLTETYLELRRLENKALSIINKGQIMFGDVLENPIKISLNQFFGIEINDFAVAVANTALFISEYQMLKETEAILNRNIDYLPLHSFVGIHEGNALRMNWNDVLPASECNFIMGNPPFLSMRNMTDINKEDLKLNLPFKKAKQLDYVTAWYFKSAEYMKNTAIETGFVSSNSIIQGEQALTIWEPLFKMGIIINFAYLTFEWDHEAAVNCVIIGFSYRGREKKIIFDNKGSSLSCLNINQYLKDQPSVFVKKAGKPIEKNIEKMTKGAQLIDGDAFHIGDKKEYDRLIKKYPELKLFIKRYLNAKMFLNNAPEEFVLYLEDCPPELLRLPFIKEIIKKVKIYRESSKAKTTRALADSPTHYFQKQVPQNESIIIPVVSSENRRYIPMNYMPKGYVFTNALFFIDNASIYTFGVLTSNVHNAWIRENSGRLKSDYRYSNTIVYNTFPWPKPTEEQKQRIEKAAENILKVREKYPNSSLADLYDPLTMPQNLLQAHRENDRAVMEAYGWNWREMSEEDCVAELMKLYQKLINNSL